VAPAWTASIVPAATVVPTAGAVPSVVRGGPVRAFLDHTLVTAVIAMNEEGQELERGCISKDH